MASRRILRTDGGYWHFERFWTTLRAFSRHFWGTLRTRSLRNLRGRSKRREFVKTHQRLINIIRLSTITWRLHNIWLLPSVWACVAKHVVIINGLRVWSSLVMLYLFDLLELKSFVIMNTCMFAIVLWLFSSMLIWKVF